MVMDTHIFIEDAGTACDMTQDRLEMNDSDPQMQLITALHDNDYPRFQELVTHDAVDLEYLYKEDEKKTCLEFAVSKPNKQKFVKLLLQHKVQLNNINKHYGCAPIHFAADNGNMEALKVLLEDDRIDVNITNKSNNTALMIVIRKMYFLNDALKMTYPEEVLLRADCDANAPNCNGDYIGCLDIFLRNSKINVNHSDNFNDTALHWSARNCDDVTVLKLLRHGASIRLRNQRNELPLFDMNAKPLQTYLDECITNVDSKISPTNEDYGICINYKFLAAPFEKEKDENDKELDAILASETDALLYISQKEELRPLLEHAVFSSFMYLQWLRISYLSYANIASYLLLWLCLILYILLSYCVEGKQADSIVALNRATHIGVIIGLIILIIRELFQLLLSPVMYLTCIINIMEIVFIFIATYIVFNDSAQMSTKQQLSAVAIIISSIELLLLIGRFPISSTYMLMLKTVSWNFFKFFLWYFIVIIAFALSFCTLLRQVESNLNNTGKEEDGHFFNDPFRALFKTIVMLTGEFDTGSIKLNTFPVTSHIMFIVFVFMVPIVLSNLLNGLAVNDTREIRANAELVGLVSRLNLISYYESVLIGKKKAYKTQTECWPWLTTHLQKWKTCISSLKEIYTKSLAERLCLFPNFLPYYNIIVKPNQDYTMWIPRKSRSPSQNHRIVRKIVIYKVDRKIVQHAKTIISKKAKITEFDEIKATLFKCETKIENIEKKIESLVLTQL